MPTSIIRSLLRFIISEEFETAKKKAVSAKINEDLENRVKKLVDEISPDLIVDLLKGFGVIIDQHTLQSLVNSNLKSWEEWASMESLTAASKLIAEFKLHDTLQKGQLEQILENLIETGSTDLAMNMAKLRKDS